MSSSKANETAASSLDWLTGGAAGAAGCSGHGVMSKDLSRCICDLSYFGTKCELVEPVKGTAIRKMKQIPYHFFSPLSFQTLQAQQESLLFLSLPRALAR